MSCLGRRSLDLKFITKITPLHEEMLIHAFFRQLESMKRLTEARAKLELRDEATEQDAR